MKFSNGCWLQKEGTECFSPAEVYDSVVTDKEVRICAPTHKITQRGDTLGGVNLTIKITSPAPEIIRVTAYHYAGVTNKGPEFELHMDPNGCMDIVDTESNIRIQSGQVSLVITKDTWLMEYYRGEELLSKSGVKDLAYMKTEWRGLAYDQGESEHTYMRQQLSIGVGELIYGFGEKFTPFVKNGQTIDCWNEDGGTSTEQSYKNIPFYISNKGYGVFVNHPEKVSFEVATEQVAKVEFSVEGESLDYFFINGPTMKEVLKHYTKLTGKPSLPAPWTFGLWLSTSFTTNYDEETVTSFVDGMRERDIPLRVFHFDCFWMKEFHWTDFTWDARVFPDPKGMLQRLKEKGLKICVWINSYIGQESCLFEEGVENGYFVKRQNGDVWQWDMWQPGMALVDFTNPSACQWFASKLEELLDMGVDCFKTDFGERIPTNVVYYDGSNPKKMHNYYTYLYNKCVYEVIKHKKGEKDAIVFARSATVGGQKFPVHWGGDCWSDFESMEQSLRGGLSLTMSGFGFWSHDIGGFEKTATPDVYKRWAAFGLLSSHSRLHGSSSYRVPWVYDEESVDVVRFFTKLKASIMPYLYAQAINTANTGIPTMRSLVLEFTEDPTVYYIDKQYMLGDSIMVAPIFNKESMAQYYLPQGKWTNYLTGEVKQGGQWIKEKHDYLSIPMLIRENSIVAVGNTDTVADYDYAQEVNYKVYCLLNEVKTTAKVYNADSVEESCVEVIREDQVITIQVNCLKPCTVTLINCLVQEENGVVRQEGNNSLITFSEGRASVECTIV